MRRPHVAWPLLVACLALCACKPNTPPTPVAVAEPVTARQETAATPDLGAIAKQQAPEVRYDPVSPEHFVFVGKTLGTAPPDCAIWDTPQAPHRRPPLQFHDATDYPERHPVAIDVVEFVQSPTRVDPAPLRYKEEPATVAFALAPRTFHSPHDSAPHDAYDRGYCERLHGILTAPFVVVQAYEVHVDRGNSAPSLWDETFGSLGTDPGKATKGFATLAEAKAFAATLMAGAAEAADAGP